MDNAVVEVVVGVLAGHYMRVIISRKNSFKCSAIHDTMGLSHRKHTSTLAAIIPRADGVVWWVSI